MNYRYAFYHVFCALMLCAPQMHANVASQSLDQRITPTLVQSIETALLTKLAPSWDVLQTCSPWIEQNQDVIAAALGYEQMTGSVKALHDAMNMLLARKNIKNLSNFNYVFVIPNTAYIIKIAGHANRKHNLNTLYHYLHYPENPFGELYNYGRSLTPEDYQMFDQRLTDTDFDHAFRDGELVAVRTAPKTFQTISRATNYLAFKDAQAKHNLSYLAAPETFLMHIPGRPTELSDRNYLIIERRVDGLERIKDVSEQQGKEIDIAVTQANLFDYSKENMFALQNAIVFVDFEQPNNANPQQFMAKARTILAK